ncbi:MAG: hypothetical protein FJZ58_06395 [Chlamydiae bacterium]|nr:hypothetical protein [Chlamydiota bacterium]
MSINNNIQQATQLATKLSGQFWINDAQLSELNQVVQNIFTQLNDNPSAAAKTQIQDLKDKCKALEPQIARGAMMQRVWNVFSFSIKIAPEKTQAEQLQEYLSKLSIVNKDARNTITTASRVSSPSITSMSSRPSSNSTASSPSSPRKVLRRVPPEQLQQEAIQRIQRKYSDKGARVELYCDLIGTSGLNKPNVLAKNLDVNELQGVVDKLAKTQSSSRNVEKFQTQLPGILRSRLEAEGKLPGA